MEELLKDENEKKQENAFVERVCISPSVELIAGELKEEIRKLLLWKIAKAERRIWLWRVASIAAVVLLFFSTGIYWWQNHSSSTGMMVEITATDGETKEVILPDQSKVLLNSGSTVRYENGFEKKRNIFLSGEAFFNVKHDTNHPFIVHCEVVSVKVYGTRFNVQSYTGCPVTEVTLVEGRISVSDDEEASLYLIPGEQAVYNKDNKKISKWEIDPWKYTCWTEGIIYFEKNNLEKVAFILSNRFKKTIHITSDKLKTITFTGEFKAGDALEDILHIITWGRPIGYHIQGDDVYLYEK